MRYFESARARGNKKTAGLLRRPGFENDGSIRRLGALDGAFLHPGHQGAELGPGLFDGVLFAFLKQGVVVRIAGLVFFTQVLANFPD